MNSPKISRKINTDREAANKHPKAMTLSEMKSVVYSLAPRREMSNNTEEYLLISRDVHLDVPFTDFLTEKLMEYID